MKVIPPIAITDALLTSSTATEPAAGETAWVSGTSYIVGDVRIRTSTHRKYQCMVAVSGTTPPETDTASWLDIGPTNKWAMFDTLRNTATVVSSPLTVVITPGKRINSLALMGMVADSATVTMTVGATTVYSHTESLILRHTTTWHDYFFGVFKYQPSVVLFDLPPYVGAVITVTLTSASGNVSCGALVIGTSVYIGSAQYSSSNGALNFSTITRDAFGNATLVPRRTVPKVDAKLIIDKDAVDNVLDLRILLNAVPAVWSGLDDKNDDGYFNSLLILGIYKELSINLDQPMNASVTLQLEEI